MRKERSENSSVDCQGERRGRKRALGVTFFAAAPRATTGLGNRIRPAGAVEKGAGGGFPQKGQNNVRKRSLPIPYLIPRPPLASAVNAVEAGVEAAVLPRRVEFL